MTLGCFLDQVMRKMVRVSYSFHSFNFNFRVHLQANPDIKSYIHSLSDFPGIVKTNGQILAFLKLYVFIRKKNIDKCSCSTYLNL